MLTAAVVGIAAGIYGTLEANTIALGDAAAPQPASFAEGYPPSTPTLVQTHAR